MMAYNIDLSNKTILVTGAAGFIGANLVKRLLNDSDNVKVVGVDSITDYYDVRLKHERLNELEQYGDRFVFVKGNIAYYFSKPLECKKLLFRLLLHIMVFRTFFIINFI